MLLGLGTLFLVGGAFVFGLVALALLFALTVGRSSSMLMVVLGGVVLGSFFSALVGLVQYFATRTRRFRRSSSVAGQPGDGHLGEGRRGRRADPPRHGRRADAQVALNVLSLGDDEASSLGLHPSRVRWAFLLSCALMVAGAVAVSGVIGWVGLVILISPGCGSAPTTGPAAGQLPDRRDLPDGHRHDRPDAHRR